MRYHVFYKHRTYLYLRFTLFRHISVSLASLACQLLQLFVQGWTFPFVGLPFLFWSCRRHIHLADKDAFVVTKGRCPVFFFFAFLVVVLFVIFMPSFSCYCSYCHCSTDSNSHTVDFQVCILLSSMVFYPVKRCEHAYQYFIVAYSMGKVRQLCGYSVFVGVVEVQLRRYGGSTWSIRRMYS